MKEALAQASWLCGFPHQRVRPTSCSHQERTEPTWVPSLCCIPKFNEASGDPSLMTGRGQEHQRRVTMNPWGLLPSPEGQGLNVLQERKCVPDPTVQSLSHVRLFATQWTVAPQASLPITNCWSLLKLTSIESVMPSNHLILCRPFLLLPLIFPSIRVFSSQFFALHGQSIGVSTSASVLPMNIQN